jgi:hypothetical protein
MQRRILIVFGILGALAGIAGLLLLLLHSPRQVRVEVVPAPPPELPAPPPDEFKAERQSGTLRGLVLNKLTDQPIAGATVIALAPHLEANPEHEPGAEQTSVDELPVWGNLVERKRVKTREDGTFDIEELPPDYWNLWVEKRGYAWTTLPRAKFAEDRHVIKLGPACSVYGKVVNPDGSPAPGVRIEYTPQGTHSEVFSRYRLKSYYTETKEDGSFQYNDIPDGPFTIEVYPSDHLPAPWIHEEPLKPGENRDLGVHKLDDGFGMEVQVLWRGTNEPVSGIEVVVRPVGDPMPRTKIGQRRTTDSEGTARFQGLGGQVMDEPGFLVAANVPGLGPVMPDTPGLISPDSKVTIYLRKAGVVKGKVVGPDGEPVTRFSASLEAVDHVARQLVVWGENGAFTIYQVPAGRYRLRIRWGSYVDAVVPVEAAGGVETDVGTITLRSGAEIYGSVTRANGKPLEGVVKVLLSARVKNRAGRESYQLVRRAWVQKDGTYRLRGIPEGTFFLQPESVSQESTTTPPERVEVPPNAGGIERNLVLYGEARMRIRFLDLVRGQERQVVPPTTWAVEERSGKEIRWYGEGTTLRPGKYTVYVDMNNAEGVSQRYRCFTIDLQEDGDPDPIEVRLYEIRDGG